jgi:hypothetical protein
MSGYPITELGDLKNGEYSYTDLISSYTGVDQFIIDKVRTSKLTDRTRKTLANELYIGFVDFDILKYRYRFE